MPTTTQHSVIIDDSRRLTRLEDSSVDLVVTSPPYPMIEMWDDLFGQLSPRFREALDKEQGNAAFESAHLEMDKVWTELARVVKDNGFICINIGDATRSIAGDFQLYSNHARIIKTFQRLGLNTLPIILWRKPTNAPNKFMGSGVLPAGAYVTLEHEYVLIFRKGGKREFVNALDKEKRRESAFFWEERNQWFSDVWFDLRGTTQCVADPALRERSAAFPFELAYRLISMYSLYDDVVLDPFLGTGTTSIAAMAARRNSIGVEIDPDFAGLILQNISACAEFANQRVEKRLADHVKFVEDHIKQGKNFKHSNSHYGFPVKMKQETDLRFYQIDAIKQIDSNTLKVDYTP